MKSSATTDQSGGSSSDPCTEASARSVALPGTSCSRRSSVTFCWSSSTTSSRSWSRRSPRLGCGSMVLGDTRIRRIYSVRPSRPANTRNAAAKSLSAVSAAMRPSPTVPGWRAPPVQDIDDRLAEVGLEQPVLRRTFDSESGFAEGGGRRRHVRLGHHDVDVMGRFGGAVCPQCVAARERERGAVLFERRHRAAQRFSKFAGLGRRIHGHYGIPGGGRWQPDAGLCCRSTV